MIASLRRNALERVLLPSGAWIDRHPLAVIVALAVLVCAAGSF
jgi:hypothetical protein